MHHLMVKFDTLKKLSKIDCNHRQKAQSSKLHFLVHFHVVDQNACKNDISEKKSQKMCFKWTQNIMGFQMNFILFYTV